VAVGETKVATGEASKVADIPSISGNRSRQKISLPSLEFAIKGHVVVTAPVGLGRARTLIRFGEHIRHGGADGTCLGGPGVAQRFGAAGIALKNVRDLPHPGLLPTERENRSPSL
jgi:hypothetical protein